MARSGEFCFGGILSSVENSDRSETNAGTVVSRETVFISAAATEQVLEWDDMIAGLRAAYAAPHQSHTSYRAVARGNKTWLRGLVSCPPASRFMGTKVFGVARERKVSYLVSLFDQETSELVALVDALNITALRTAATSAVAVDAMAKGGALNVGVLGSGAEAQEHLGAIARVRPLKSVRVFSPTAVRREAFAARFSEELKVDCKAVATSREAVEGVDLLVAAARSHDETPIFSGDWLRPGQMVVSIGATLPEQHEIDPRTIEVCDLIVCDMVHEVIEETGDFIDAKKAGVAFDHKMASLNDLIMGKLAGRLASARIPMYKSVGAAIQDITVAEIAYQRAIERKLAVPLPMALVPRQV